MATRPLTRPADDGTLYAPVARLKAWFEAAAPGSNMMFARGPVVDWEEPAAALVAQWIRAGAVTRHQGRDGQGPETTGKHIVVRAFPALGKARAAQAPEFDRTPQGRVFRLIEEAALDGLPCPSNAELAELAGLRRADADRGKYMVQLLVKAGRIRVRKTGANERIVTIVESGASTALPRRFA